VCQVDDGSGAARQIVCGAKNYKVGDKVPLALPGAKLGADFVIKVGKLRGVESQGMMCSADELGLPATAGFRGAEDGLLILSPAAKLGAPIGDLFPGDTVLDLEITPNRPDLLSHYGIAREIGALAKTSVRPPALKNTGPVQSREDVVIETKDCWMYSARKIEGVKVGPSPEWLQRKLQSVGLRPINNVVDITNYVMFELGQPLHAFDGAKLRGALRVRSGQEDEDFLALDGKTYALKADDIVIADDERAVAIGGVMGGEDTGVTESTIDVWLEAADFQPQSIRRTSRRLGLISDSSYRFERGIDFDGILYASQRATELIVELAGGTPGPIRDGYSPSFKEDASDSIEGDVYFGDKPSEQHSHSVELRPSRLKALLGVEIPESEVHDILTRLGLEFEDGKWAVPSFRPDLTREVDLIEEVARVIGMEGIPSRVQARFSTASASDRAYDRAMELRRALVAQGLHEGRSLTLVPTEPLGLAATQSAVENLQRVKNPMIDDQIVLRPNLLHGLLTAVRDNIRAGSKSVRLFEIGRVFSTRKPEEFSHAAIVLTGPKSERTWRSGEGAVADLFDVKGVLSAVLGAATSFEKDANEGVALSLAVKVNGKPIGFAGQLWPADARGLDTESPVLFAEIDLTALAKAESTSVARRYNEIPRFPSVTRDIAMLAPLQLSHEAITSSLSTAKEPLLAGTELFDVFVDPSGAKIPADKKSLAYSLTYRSSERTLTADEVNAAHAKLKQKLVSECGVSLRE
ncbi:MAG TPA: phenylalanine--tRNA ligase subunit beta, partial [Chthoniobacteraceae bacterium]|nr:phenylalanine--tRNA ligase subunit beta [Chthoniobacteraceae bacterium]